MLSAEKKGYVYMVLLALQFGLQPILVRQFTSNDTFKCAVVIMCEIFKFMLCFFMLVAEGTLTQVRQAWKLRDSLEMAGILHVTLQVSIAPSYKSTFSLSSPPVSPYPVSTTTGLPALIYSVQNILAQVAYQNLDGVTFNVINQTKTLFGALCLFFVLGQRQSLIQCGALAALFAASLILSTQDAAVDKIYSFEYVVLPVFSASVLSGVAQALSQKCLQGAKRNPFLYTMELSMFSTAALLVTLPLSPEWVAVQQHGFLHAFRCAHSLSPINA